MDKFDSKVVSFERNADYLRQRALKNRREGKSVDALELMRQASLREPENMAYAMELADMYSEMGLQEPANRAMLRVMMKTGAKNECLYLMANNLYHRGEISRAERVLRAYLEGGAEGERAAQAERFLVEIDYAKHFSRSRDRKQQRAARFAGRAYTAMRSGNAALGERLLAKSLRFSGRNPETRALYALCLFLNEKAEQARIELNNIERLIAAQAEDRTNIKARCISAQVWNYLGQRDKAQAIMDAALAEEADEMEATMRVMALCEMAMHTEAYEACQLALKKSPYDKTLMHISSAAAFNAGLPLEEVLRGWQRISRLDADDPVAAYFLQAAQAGTLHQPLIYVYMLPGTEMTRRFAYVTDCVRAGADALAEAWKADEEFRSLLLWELVQGNEQLARTAITVLAGIPDDEARALVRIYAERPDADLNLRLYAMSMMRLQGIEPDASLSDSFLSAGMPSEEEIMGAMSVGEKQMIRYAADYVEDTQGDYPVADIALIWNAFVEAKGSAPDPVCRSEAGSAALAMVYLQMKDCADDIYSISRWYGCSPRQAAHIARRLRDVIGMSNTED